MAQRRALHAEPRKASKPTYGMASAAYQRVSTWLHRSTDRRTVYCELARPSVACGDVAAQRSKTRHVAMSPTGVTLWLALVGGSAAQRWRVEAQRSVQLERPDGQQRLHHAHLAWNTKQRDATVTTTAQRVKANVSTRAERSQRL